MEGLGFRVTPSVLEHELFFFVVTHRVLKHELRVVLFARMLAPGFRFGLVRLV